MGDKISPGAVLASIETDKAAVDFEMQEDGYIAQLLFPEGTNDIPLGTPIAIVVDNEKDVAAFANFKSGSVAEEKKEKVTLANSVNVKPAASALPDHIRLEMPNLSPTMEKVSLSHN